MEFQNLVCQINEVNKKIRDIDYDKKKNELRDLKNSPLLQNSYSEIRKFKENMKIFHDGNYRNPEKEKMASKILEDLITKSWFKNIFNFFVYLIENSGECEKKYLYEINNIYEKEQEFLKIENEFKKLEEEKEMLTQKRDIERKKITSIIDEYSMEIFKKYNIDESISARFF